MAKFGYRILLPVLLFSAASGAHAAPPAMDAVASEMTANTATIQGSDGPAYITDVQGNRVRLVGPRFLTNPSRALDFPGREEMMPILSAE